MAAWSLHIAVALIACTTLAVIIHRSPGRNCEGALIGATAALASPHLFDYDLAVLTVPLAWLLREGSRTGFLPRERIAMLVAFILPAVSRGLAGALLLPIAPVVVGAILTLIVRRCFRRHNQPITNAVLSLGWRLTVPSNRSTTDGKRRPIARTRSSCPGGAVGGSAAIMQKAVAVFPIEILGHLTSGRMAQGGFPVILQMSAVSDSGAGCLRPVEVGI